jgi:hypothetical protein
MSQWHSADRVTIHGGGTATDFHCFPLFRFQDQSMEPLANSYSVFILDCHPCQPRQSQPWERNGSPEKPTWTLPCCHGNEFPINARIQKMELMNHRILFSETETDTTDMVNRSST